MTLLVMNECPLFANFMFIVTILDEWLLASWDKLKV